MSRPLSTSTNPSDIVSPSFPEDLRWRSSRASLGAPPWPNLAARANRSRLAGSVRPETMRDRQLLLTTREGRSKQSLREVNNPYSIQWGTAPTRESHVACHGSQSCRAPRVDREGEHT